MGLRETKSMEENNDDQKETGRDGEEKQIDLEELVDSDMSESEAKGTLLAYREA